MWGNLVTWKSQKQRVVSRSSAKSELRALAQGIIEELWIRRVMEEIQVRIDPLVKLYCDNKVAISMALNPIQHERSKLEEVDRHFIRESRGKHCMFDIPTYQVTSC